MSARGLFKVRNFAALAMFAAIFAAWWMRPQPPGAPSQRLAQIVPAAFGDWREVDTPIAPVDPTAAREAGRDTDSPYDDVLMRAYSDSHGNVVMLALAYGRDQHQEVKIHRPELCYVAQGFKVLRRWPRAFVIPGRQSPAPPDGSRMLVQAPGRTEAVSYWIRIGQSYSSNAWVTRYYIFREGLKRRNPDGLLVRVSQILDSPESASEERYRVQEQFISELVSAVPAAGRHILVAG